MHETGFDCAEHASERVNLFDVGARPRFDFVREFFDRVRTGKGINRIRDATFLRDDLLRAEGDRRGVFGGKRQRFIEAVSV